MSLNISRVLAFIAFSATIGLIAHDSRYHFSEELILVKRQHGSAQRNWNIFYGQRFVYYDSAFRYQRDFEQIEDIIEPGYVLFSDLATSYYSAAMLPVYVRNVRRHQGRKKSSRWSEMLDTNLACNLHQAEALSRFKIFIKQEQASSRAHSRPLFRYVLFNKDTNNKNVRSGCLWNRRALVMESILPLARLKYEGEFLNLYELKNADAN